MLMAGGVGGQTVVERLALPPAGALDGPPAAGRRQHEHRWRRERVFDPVSHPVTPFLISDLLIMSVLRHRAE